MRGIGEVDLMGMGTEVKSENRGDEHGGYWKN